MFISLQLLNLIIKRVIYQLHYKYCLKIESFLQKVSAVTLRKELKIYFFFKYNMIEHMKRNVRKILILYFVSVMTAQHAFYNFLHCKKYYYCRIRYA